jgi:hypothetical protein
MQDNKLSFNASERTMTLDDYSEICLVPMIRLRLSQYTDEQLIELEQKLCEDESWYARGEVLQAMKQRGLI